MAACVPQSRLWCRLQEAEAFRLLVSIRIDHFRPKVVLGSANSHPQERPFALSVEIVTDLRVVKRVVLIDFLLVPRHISNSFNHL